MKMFVPNLHEDLTLAKPWKILVTRSYYTEKLLIAAGYELPERYTPNPQRYAVTFPAGTVLNVKKYDIKQGYDDEASLNLYIKDSGELGFKGKLTVRLADFNEMEIVPPTAEREFSIKVTT